ncbi:MAG: class I SAM-dependent methyltransferase [Chloroflexi bacterium]|nr:class I SAM-dependent methyltransferase [Chloroflexota bacterium]
MPNLTDIIQRLANPEPWSEGDNIPWNDPDFSRRMLKEHLTQEHDAASRRFGTIDEHVDWIHGTLLQKRPSRILDLACGPGLYSNRLAALGHTCVGIDYSPASIAYAREQAALAQNNVQFVEQDIRIASYGSGYDLVMLLFGELNIFRIGDAENILRKAHSALKPGAFVLLEPHTFEIVEGMGMDASTWFSYDGGLFSDRKHIVLSERLWQEPSQTTTIRHYIIDAETAAVTRMAQSFQAYTTADYENLLNRCGFLDVKFHPSLLGRPDPNQADLIALTARKENQR